MPTDGTTFVNNFALWFTLSMGLLMIVLPRRHALVPVIILTCFMTMGQRVVIVGLDFTMLRILLLFGWFRLVIRQETDWVKLGAIDKAILIWTVCSIITFTILWQTSEAFINRLGHAYNAIGLYFLFRFLIRSWEDVGRVWKILAILIFPLAAFMLVEKTTGRNVFALFGGVPEMTVVRHGILRCQGPFAHPILAGTFGATQLPLFVGLWWHSGGSRLLAIMGIISCTIIIVTAGSSGPVFACLAVIGALCLWPLRRHMRLVLSGFVLLVIALQLVMKAPVWFLMGRVTVFEGSTGWHRAYVIDRAIAHLDEWWFVGTKSTVEWGTYLHDITNQYIVEGVNGGLLTMALFIAIIAFGFRGLDRSLRALDRESLRAQASLWALGAALWAHAVTFMSVSYFDQNIVVWYLLLAMISSTAGQSTSAPGLASNEAARFPWAGEFGYRSTLAIRRKSDLA